MAEKKELLFDGKEKRIYSTEDPDVVMISYNDVVTAFGGIKRADIKGKGECNNIISAICFKEIGKAGVPTHFIEVAGPCEQLCHKIEIIPLQIIIRNRLAGTTAKLLGLPNGTEIPNTVFELRYNCDELHDPMINDHHAVALGLISYEDLGQMYDMARRCNEALCSLFHKAGIELVDFKIEFGRAADGRIILSDEISPDNSRLWDEKTGEVLDKDRFRHDLSDVCASYKEVMDRLKKVSQL